MKPSDVATGVENVGVLPAVKADPETHPPPLGCPVRDVTTVTVADALADRPVTVNGNVDPDAVPAVTVPALADGVNE